MKHDLDMAGHVRRQQAEKIGMLHHKLAPAEYMGLLIFQRGMLSGLALGIVFLAALFGLAVIL